MENENVKKVSIKFLKNLMEKIDGKRFPSIFHQKI
jgi:hypothetical protein